MKIKMSMGMEMFKKMGINMGKEMNMDKEVEGRLNPGLFNPKLQPRTFQTQTFQP